MLFLCVWGDIWNLTAENKSGFLLVSVLILKKKKPNLWIIKAWKCLKSWFFFAMANERVVLWRGKKKCICWKTQADASSKDSIYIPTFFQNKSAFLFKNNFHGKGSCKVSGWCQGAHFYHLCFVCLAPLGCKILQKYHARGLLHNICGRISPSYCHETDLVVWKPLAEVALGCVAEARAVTATVSQSHWRNSVLAYLLATREVLVL